MRKTRLIAWLCVMCMLTLIPMAGLSEITPASAEEIAKYQPDDNKKYELHVAGWLAGPVDNENGPVISEMEKQTGLRIVSENIDGSKYNDLISLRLASGDIPDLYSLTPHATFSKFYDQGVVKSFTEQEFAALAPGLYNLIMEEAPGALDLVRLDPEHPELLMGIPQYKFHSQFIFPFIWRKDWLVKVGIDKIPDNMDEFEEAAYKFAKNDPDGNGKDDTYGVSTSGVDAVYAAYGYRPEAWSDRDGKLVFGAVQPEMKDALERLAKWYQDGVIDPEFITGENTGGRADISAAFNGDRVGMTRWADYWTWCPVNPVGLNWQEFAKSHENAEEILAITQPILAMDGVSRNTYRAPVVQNTFWCFSADIPDDLFGKAMQFLDWEYGTYENYRLAWYGIQGEHWDFDEENHEQPIGEYALDKGLQNKIGAYTTMGAIVEPFDYQGRVRAGLAPWAEGIGLSDPNFTQFGIVDKLLVTTPSYNMYWVELEKIREEAYIDIITGKKPIAYFDEFVDRWMQSGGAAITEEANEWYASTQHNK